MPAIVGNLATESTNTQPTLIKSVANAAFTAQGGDAAQSDTQTNTPQGAPSPAQSAGAEAISKQGNSTATFGQFSQKAQTLWQSLNQWGAAVRQWTGDEFNALPGTASDLFPAIGRTFVSGEAASGAAGAADRIANWWTLGGWSYYRLDIGPLFGKGNAYYQGEGAGKLTVILLDVATWTKGGSNLIRGFGTIRAAGGVIQVGQLVAVNGARVNVLILANGEVVVATQEILQALGASAQLISSFGNDDLRVQQVFSQALPTGGQSGIKAILPQVMLSPFLTRLPGKLGKTGPIKEVPDVKALDDLFSSLTKDAKTIPSGTYPGVVKELPDGTIVRMRGASKSGGAALDITMPGGKIIKVHIKS